REHAGRQVAHHVVLRRSAHLLVLRRLFAGWPSRPDGGPAVSGGFRWDRRWRPLPRLDPSHDGGALDGPRVAHEEPGDGPAAGETRSPHAEGARSLRRPRQRAARLSRGPAPLLLRPGAT